MSCNLWCHKENIKLQFILPGVCIASHLMSQARLGSWLVFLKSTWVIWWVETYVVFSMPKAETVRSHIFDCMGCTMIIEPKLLTLLTSGVRASLNSTPPRLQLLLCMIWVCLWSQIFNSFCILIDSQSTWCFYTMLHMLFGNMKDLVT